MENILTVLSQNILPIFIVAFFGFVLQRWVGIDKKTLSTAVLYILSPCLVFSSLVGSQLPSEELAEIAIFAILNIAAIGMIGLVVAKLLRFSRKDTAALLVVIMFVNGGNYGMTLNQLRYGDAGLARAVVYYTTSTVILYTVGIFISSMGELDWRQSVNKLIRFPTVYAGRIRHHRVHHEHSYTLTPHARHRNCGTRRYPCDVARFRGANGNLARRNRLAINHSSRFTALVNWAIARCCYCFADRFNRIKPFHLHY